MHTPYLFLTPFKNIHIRCLPSDRGSAGANCWFDAGHSDSMDPMTFRRSALGGHGAGRKGGEQRWGVGGSFSWGEGFGGWRLGSG